MKKMFWKLLRWLLAILLLTFLAYQAWFAANIYWWRTHNPATSAFMEDQLQQLKQKNPKARLQHKWVDYKNISSNLKRALITAEDAKFVDHDGFDWDGIQLAYEKNLARGKVVAGGSTISQQLAKNLFLSTKRSPWRKAEEALITLMLESMMDKERIFEIYLNTIEWGEGVFGAEAAAQHYFQCNASSLTTEQAAILAAIVPSPRYFDKHRDSKFLAQKVEFILVNLPFAVIP